MRPYPLHMMVLFCNLILPAVAWGFQVQSTSEQTGNKVVRWANQPVTFEIHKDGSKDVTDGSDIQAIKDALNAWTVQGCALQFAFTTSESTSYAGRPKDPNNPTGDKDRDGKSLIRFETANWEWSENILMQRSIYFTPTTGELKEVDVLFNNVHYTWASTPTANAVEIKTVLFYQAGFLLGLWYSEFKSAVMHESRDRQNGPITLAQDDKDGICFLYPSDGWKEQAPPAPKEFGPEPIAPEPTPTPDTKTTTPPSQQGCQCNASSSDFDFVYLLMFIFIGASVLKRRPRT
ncbi:MAG: hypothetical protein CL920_37110 [Deltaproteobacteria bacterium]|nr:hypothetical protein [Deltaproteobacteria bacterium]MBU54351.1 hypothetical protein [Deltaproteobacteria bacterium]